MEAIRICSRAKMAGKHVGTMAVAAILLLAHTTIPWVGGEATECARDADCATNLACLGGACLDPCLSSPCPMEGGICSVVGRRPLCACPKGSREANSSCIQQSQCIRDGRVYEDGQQLYDELCTERCECHLGNWLCEETRCSPGLIPRGLLDLTNDPQCQERDHPAGDECCVLWVCADEAEVDEDASLEDKTFNEDGGRLLANLPASNVCENVLCGINAECVEEVGGKCACLAGYVGDPNDLVNGCDPERKDEPNIRILQITTDSIQIQFPRTNGGNLMYVESTALDTKDPPWENAIILQNNDIFTLKGLKKGTEYTLRWKTPEKQYPDVKVSTSESDPKVILVNKTHDSALLLFDSFRPPGNMHSYVVTWKEEGENSWRRQEIKEEDRGTPSVLLGGLKPNQTYQAKISIYENYTVGQLGLSTEDIKFTTKPGCVYNSKTYPVGPFYIGCETACTCEPNGETECGERCIPPHYKSGSFASDPYCEERFVDDTECCVIVTCTGGVQEEDSPCQDVTCGENAVCKHDVSSEESNSTICVCQEGFIGDPDSETGCSLAPPPGTTTLPTQNVVDACVVQNTTYRPGEEWFDGCEFRCSCSTSLEILCQPRCKLIPEKVDPDCRVEEDSVDPCCQTMICPDQIVTGPIQPGLLFEGCVFKNVTYQKDERFYDGCEQQCECVGFGDLVCVARCPPNSPEIGDNCYTLPDLTDSCCNVTVCDKSETSVQDVEKVQLEPEDKGPVDLEAVVEASPRLMPDIQPPRMEIEEQTPRITDRLDIASTHDDISVEDDLSEEVNVVKEDDFSVKNDDDLNVTDNIGDQEDVSLDDGEVAVDENSSESIETTTTTLNAEVGEGARLFANPDHAQEFFEKVYNSQNESHLVLADHINKDLDKAAENDEDNFLFEDQESTELREQPEDDYAYYEDGFLQDIYPTLTGSEPEAKEDDLDVSVELTLLGQFHQEDIDGKIEGELYMVNKSTLLLKDFTMNPKGPLEGETFFYAGEQEDPVQAIFDDYGDQGATVQLLWSSSGDQDAVKHLALEKLEHQDLYLWLPPRVQLEASRLRWLALRSDSSLVDLATISWSQATAEEGASRSDALESRPIPGGCLYKEQEYKHGETFYSGCEKFCSCGDDGLVACYPIKCPSHFGLDVISPHCIEWDKHEDFVPEAPLCCPPVPVCMSDGSCFYKGQNFSNYSPLPEDLTGCEERCHCDNTEVKCQPACYEVPKDPPGWLACDASRAKLVSNPDRTCCQIWGCAEEEDACVAMPRKLPHVEANAVNDTAISVVFQLPEEAVGRKGHYVINYSSGFGGHPDPDRWPADLFEPAGGHLESPGERVEKIFGPLVPNTDYYLKPSVVVEDCPERIVIAGNLLNARTDPIGSEGEQLPLVIYLDLKLEVSDVGPTSAVVSWRHFEPDEKPYVDGVQLRYQVLKGDQPLSQVPETSPFIHRDTNYFQFDNLTPDTRYEVELNLIPVIGSGRELYSGKKLEFVTAPKTDIFDFDIELSLDFVGWKSVEVSWFGVPSPDQKFVNIYRIIYHATGLNAVRDETSVFKISKIDSPKRVLIDSLQPLSDYQIWLEAYLTNGKTKKSNVLGFRTEADGGVIPTHPDHALPLGDGPSPPPAANNDDWYRSMVAAAVIAAIAIAGFLVVLYFYLKRNITYKATITKIPKDRPINMSSSAYDNNSFKNGGGVGGANGHHPHAQTIEMEGFSAPSLAAQQPDGAANGNKLSLSSL